MELHAEDVIVLERRTVVDTVCSLCGYVICVIRLAEVGVYKIDIVTFGKESSCYVSKIIIVIRPVMIVIYDMIGAFINCEIVKWSFCSLSTFHLFANWFAFAK